MSAMRKTTFPLGLALVLALSGCTGKNSDFQASFQRFVPWETEDPESMKEVEEAAEAFVEDALQGPAVERDYSFSSKSEKERNSYEQSLREAEDDASSELYRAKREARRAYDNGEAYKKYEEPSPEAQWESSDRASRAEEDQRDDLDE